MKKSEFISWTPLSPSEIYIRHRTMYKWSIRAKKRYLELEGFRKKEIDSLLRLLLRKTSAEKACEVIVQISNFFELTPLTCYGTQQKFSGLLGINHLVNMALAGVYFHSGVKKDISSMMGGISIDLDRPLKLGLMLKQHDLIQGKVACSGNTEKQILATIIEKISACSREERYPLQRMLKYGEEINSFLYLNHNPIELGLKWQGIVDTTGKDFDFYPVSRDKQDNGFFQYLCIVLLSLDLNSKIH